MAMAAMADGLKVADLRVGTLHNPEGVDAPPQFSWKLTSDRRSTLQTAYRIVVSRSPKGKDKVFDTGFLKSDQSCGVIILLPATTGLLPSGTTTAARPCRVTKPVSIPDSWVQGGAERVG